MDDPSPAPDGNAPAACNGDCAGCPAVRDHLAGHAPPAVTPGPYHGAAFVWRCLAVFTLPLLVAIAGGLAIGVLSGTSGEGMVLVGVLAGGLVGMLGGRLLTRSGAAPAHAAKEEARG